MKEVEAQENRVAALTALADGEDIKATGKSVAAIQLLLASLEEHGLRVADQTAVVMRSLEKSKHSMLMQWLSPVPFVQHHRDHSRKNIPGCGQRFMNHPEYRKWKLTSSSSFLVLHGIPGSGKTSLAAYVVDSFLQDSPGQDGSTAAPLAYFYCTRNSFEPSRSDPEEVIWSVVRQLAFGRGSGREVHEIVVTDYERRQEEAELNGVDIPRLSISECMVLILDLTQLNPATIIIDAVDELQETHLYKLMQALNMIIRESASVVKILITCRDHLIGRMPDGLKVRIQSSECRGDMVRFVRHLVTEAIRQQRLLRGEVANVLRDELIQTLVLGAKEMYVNESMARNLEADESMQVPMGRASDGPSLSNEIRS